MIPLPTNATLSDSAIFNIKENGKEFSITLAQLKTLMGGGGGGSYTPGDGIQIENGEISLDLTDVETNQPINIQGTNSMALSTQGGNLSINSDSFLSISGGNAGIAISAPEEGLILLTTGSFVVVTPTSNLSLSNGLNLTTPSVILNVSDEIRIVSPITIFESAPVSYFEDYSASYNNRSLVDKQYVDNAIASAIAAI